MTDQDITDELKRLSRRIEDIARTIDTLTNDRQILEDVLTRLSSVENSLHIQRANQTEMVKNIKEEMNEVKDTVESKIDEANINIDEKTVIVKAPEDGVIQKILSKLKGR